MRVVAQASVQAPHAVAQGAEPAPRESAVAEQAHVAVSVEVPALHVVSELAPVHAAAPEPACSPAAAQKYAAVWLRAVV